MRAHVQHSDVIVIGAGQAGLAMSHQLGQRGIDHVVLERGRIAERWRSERWPALQLLTPNWQSRLPGYAYSGPQPDGFMTITELVHVLERYAAHSSAPVQSQTRVRSVEPHAGGYRVRSDRGDFTAAHVVIATGYCDVPARPDIARSLRGDVQQLAPNAYRTASALPPGGVLVVGGSASGVQIADDLARSGRSVTLAVGRHTRLPRRYRGADIMAWLDRIGSLNETIEDVRDPRASRAQPSLQLVGSDPARDLDLATLAQRGVRICGRLNGVSGARVQLADDLSRSVHAADAKLRRLLSRIDDYIAATPALSDSEPQPHPAPIDVAALRSTHELDLAAEGISTLIWATGFRRDYRWLQVPVFDADGELIHARGVTPSEGLYALGLRFQHTRKSSFIDGVGADAEYIARQIAARLGMRESVAA
jgi:putative flavoprotein involved in K+ transport